MQSQTQLDALMRAKALARWEGEGGALAPCPEEDLVDDVSLRLPANPGAAVSESCDDVPQVVQLQIGLERLARGPSPPATANLARFINQLQRAF